MEHHCCTPAPDDDEVFACLSQATHRECLVLSNEAYEADGGNPPGGWEVLDAYYPPGRYDLGMATYINRKRRLVVVSVRGTQSITSVWDLLTDFGIWSRQVPPHLDDAVNRAYDVVNEAANGGADDDNQEDGGEGGRPGISQALVMSLAGGVSMALLQYIFVDAAIYAGSVGLAGSFAGDAGLIAFSAAAVVAGVSAMALSLGRRRDEIDPNAGKKGVLSVTDDAAKSASAMALESAAELLSRTDDNLEAGQRGVQNVVNSERIRSVTFTGHSLGGTVAELLACRLCGRLTVPVKAVTFESPGCSDLVELLEGYQHEDYGFITTYLSAPHIVNTCHGHLGTVRRVFIPHSPGTWGSALGHGFKSLSGSLGRSALYVGAVCLFAAPEAVPLAAQLALGGAAGVGVGSLIGDALWFLRQHSTIQLLELFPESHPYGVPSDYDEMSRWPLLATTIFGVTRTAAASTLNSLKPLPPDKPGIRTMRSENLMFERRVTQPDGHYVVRRRVRAEGDIDWADAVNGVMG